MIDNKALNEEFDIENIENESTNIVNTMSDENIINIENIDEVVFTNIKKANTILDRIMIEIDNEGVSPRLAEVGSMLINAINNSYDKIINKDISMKDLQLKREMLTLKEKEIEIRRSIGQPTYNQNNIIIDGNRETILKMLKDDKTDQYLIEMEEENETN
jgi:hypothetical protein